MERTGEIKGGKTRSREHIPEEHLKNFIEEINEGIYETDIHGNFIYLNNAICKVFGYPKEDIQGKNFSSFMDKRHARLADQKFTKIWVTHKGFSDIIWEIIDKNGLRRIIELSAHLIKDKKGGKIGFRGIARDVTEKFRVQEALHNSELRYQKEHKINQRAEKRTRNLLDFVPYPMVVTKLDGKVTYVNPAFTEIFGWTLKELRGKHIPYVPPDLQEETKADIKKLIKDKVIARSETRRLTKDGRVLDVIIRGAIYKEYEDIIGGQLVMLRDITQEKRMARNNDALLRISTALPAYPNLEELLDYISREIKVLMNTEGALVIMLDEERDEFSYVGVAHDNTTAEKKIKKIRFPAKRSVAGRVIRTGEPVIIHDTSMDPDFYPFVDKQIGLTTKNMLEVPLRSSDRIIGVLCARNKKEGDFDQTDVELLTLIAGTVALFIENTRFSEEIKEAYREVTSLSRAKDKVINHLSHELKTPVSVLLASLNTLRKKMKDLPEETWKPAIERSQRNLKRILEIQYQVEDIMQGKEYKSYGLLSLLLDQCADELEALVADEVGEGDIVRRVKERIESLFGSRESMIDEVHLDGYVQERLQGLAPQFSHRQIDIRTHIDEVSLIFIPLDVLQKVVDGLIKNAIENTPDEGKIEIFIKRRGESSEFIVRDYGVGITENNKRRIFEGFFMTQDTMAYSSKRPFDFNAGGKGADLLRMKIFSERYVFIIDMTSSRCRFIPKDGDVCPGRISECGFCKKKEDCHLSGGTSFSIYFPS